MITARGPADLIGNPVALAIESCLTELSVLHEAHCLPGRSGRNTVGDQDGAMCG